MARTKQYEVALKHPKWVNCGRLVTVWAASPEHAIEVAKQKNAFYIAEWGGCEVFMPFPAPRAYEWELALEA